jgi:hypothetical protein
VTLDVSALKLTPADQAWLCEISNEYSSSMPIKGRWLAYIHGGIITYYRGDLSIAERYSMHLCQPHIHVRRLPNDSAFAAICNDRGTPVTRNTLYFWDLDNPTKTSVEFMAPGGLHMLI